MNYCGQYENIVDKENFLIHQIHGYVEHQKHPQWHIEMEVSKRCIAQQTSKNLLHAKTTQDGKICWQLAFYTKILLLCCFEGVCVLTYRAMCLILFAIFEVHN